MNGDKLDGKKLAKEIGMKYFHKNFTNFSLEIGKVVPFYEVKLEHEDKNKKITVTEYGLNIEERGGHIKEEGGIAIICGDNIYNGNSVLGFIPFSAYKDIRTIEIEEEKVEIKYLFKKEKKKEVHRLGRSEDILAKYIQELGNKITIGEKQVHIEDPKKFAEEIICEHSCLVLVEDERPGSGKLIEMEGRKLIEIEGVREEKIIELNKRLWDQRGKTMHVRWISRKDKI